MDSAPFWAPAPPGEQIDPGTMSALHWEALGVVPDPEARNWLCWSAGAEDGRMLLATMALAPEAVREEWAASFPHAFEPTARLRPIPPDECAVWKEMGRTVAAFTRGDRLLHVAVLNACAPDAAAAREVHELALALRVRGFLRNLKGCRIWTAVDAEFVEALSSLLDVNVKVEDLPPPVLPRESSGLLPAIVRLKREEKSRHRDLLRLIATGLCMIVAFFATWGGSLAYREYRLGRAVEKLNAEAPEVELIRDAKLRAYALEPATNPDLYPVEVFHQILSLLPHEGVQLQNFSYEEERVVVAGIASSVNHVLKFKSDLQDSGALGRYAWTVQQTIHPEDNRASFNAEGVLTGGMSHESE